MTARHLLHVFSTFGIGGPQVRTCDLIDRFGERYRHTVIAMDGNLSCRGKLAGSSRVEYVELRFAKRNLAQCLWRFRRALARVRPDLLLTYNFGAVEWGLANRFLPVCPHVHLEEGFGPEERDRQIPRRVLVRRVFLKRVRWLVVPSRNLERIAREVWRFAPERVRYVPNGIDCARFCAGERAPGDRLRIGTVAGLRAEKNVARLVRVFARLAAEPAFAGSELVVVGDGPERTPIERQVAELGLRDRVRITGFVADTAPCYRELDVFAIPSDTEQMPISLLEAMAAGLPVAGMDVGDVRAMVAEPNRQWISPTGDDDHLERTLRALLADRALRVRLGAANRALCRAQFDQGRMLAAYAELWG